MDKKQLNIKLNNCRNEINYIEEQIKSFRKRKMELENEIQLIEVQLQETDSTANDGDKFLDEFSWSEQAQHLLNTVFNLREFRSHQLPTINATLSGYDVLLILPTGGGKSLCFQLPSLISKGLTLVISPLVSLMEDQLNGLKEIGIPTEVLNSGTERSESTRILNCVGNAKEIPFRILYVTPEKLAKSKLLMSKLEKCYQNKNLKRIVIDEVHCCSQWGHDFRQDYKFLGILRNQFPETPILGLTATATPHVIRDVQKMLNINGCYVFKDSFFRSNLHYSIDRIDDKNDLIKRVTNLLKTQYRNQSGLIYCLTIKDVEEVTQKLCANNIKALAYHAQLNIQQRTLAYQKWFGNKIQVIVATVAFGMGINKQDVRFVIHYSMSKSFENYYQETGRAGRDGLPADCILYYRFPDIFRATTLVMSEQNGLSNVYSMVNYILNRKICRKEQISTYFGDHWNNLCNNQCDNCTDKYIHKSIDLSKDMVEIEKIISFSKKQNKRITALQLLEIWLGKGKKEFRPEKLIVAKHSRDTAQDILGFLLVNNYLKEEFHFTPYSTISYLGIGRSIKNYQIEYDLCTGKKQNQISKLPANLSIANPSNDVDEDSSKILKKAKIQLESKNVFGNITPTYQSYSTSKMENSQRKIPKSINENKKLMESKKSNELNELTKALKASNQNESVIILD